MAKVISKTYGEALFELALEHGEPDAMAEQIKLLRQVLRENPEFVKLICHPKISKQEKMEVVKTVFEGRFSEEVTGFLLLLVEKERGEELDGILDFFEAKMREYKKIGVVQVTSAVDLTEEQRSKIETKLLSQTSYEKLETEYRVDASLLGGMIIRIGDRVADSSIRSKLDAMERNLKKISLNERKEGRC